MKTVGAIKIMTMECKSDHLTPNTARQTAERLFDLQYELCDVSWQTQRDVIYIFENTVCLE